MRRFVGLVLLGLSLLHFSSENPMSINQILVSNENDISNDSDNKEENITTTTTTPRACEEKYKKLSSGVKLALTTDISDTYEGAEQICAADGARLVSIPNGDVKYDAKQLMRNHRIYRAWIGLKKIKEGIAGVGEYKWTDGVVLKPGNNINGTDMNNHYTDWSGQDSFDYTSDNGKDCIFLFYIDSNFDYQWIDDACKTDIEWPVICECFA